MARCFVIQPFDKGKFDKRYDDIFAPAITSAGLDPYRVDRDPQVSIPIEDIEAGIQGSEAVLADISTDNPNVWFELGYAIASRREVALVCSDERESKFPFDVQHRSIIRYSTESSSDFEKLCSSITVRLKGLLAKERNLGEIARMSDVARVEGLASHEIALLVSVAQQADAPEDGVSAYLARQDLEKAGFNKMAATLAVARLAESGLLATSHVESFDGDRVVHYSVTPNGMQWLLDNQNILILKSDPPRVEAPSPDDVPF